MQFNAKINTLLPIGREKNTSYICFMALLKYTHYTTVYLKFYQLIYFMKNLKILTLWSLIAILAITIVSCGDDDDDATDSFTIIGTWTATGLEILIDGVETDPAGLDLPVVEGETITFKEDGTYEGDGETGTYSINNSNTTLTIDGETTWDIVEVNDANTSFELLLNEQIEVDGDMVSFTVRLSLTR